MTIDDNACEKIARRVAELLRENHSDEELISTAEAAKILRISPDRMRHLKDLFPHVQAGERGKLLFVKNGLVEKYANR